MKLQHVSKHYDFLRRSKENKQTHFIQKSTRDKGLEVSVFLGIRYSRSVWKCLYTNTQFYLRDISFIERERYIYKVEGVSWQIVLFMNEYFVENQFFPPTMASRIAVEKVRRQITLRLKTVVTVEVWKYGESWNSILHSCATSTAYRQPIEIQIFV